MAIAPTPPVVTAVALSTAYLKLGELARRAFAGGEVFVLEKGRIPLVAVVSAREWMEYLAARYPARSISVRRTALSAPRVRPSSDKLTSKPTAKKVARRAATIKRNARRRPAKSRSGSSAGRPLARGGR